MTAVTDTRVWTLRFAAPARMYSVNTTEHWRRTAAAKKVWREATYTYAQQAKLPKLLARVRIDITLHFTTRAQRDTANFHPLVGKPIVDALGAGRIVKYKGTERVEVGYELIADDTPKHLDGPHLLIGAPVPAKDHPFGLVVVTITDLGGAQGDA
jgi:hypothetical protein